MSSPQNVELTPPEQELADQLEFDALALRNGGDHARSNGELACRLMASLIARKAIPEVRARFFDDPAYNAGGRGRSRRDLFERNGIRGEDIFRHPHFLDDLRYLLFGPNLPSEVSASFVARVAECGYVTSSDVVPLGTFARQQARAHRLNFAQVADEFYKLALDLNLSKHYAMSIREAVKRAH